MKKILPYINLFVAIILVLVAFYKDDLKKLPLIWQYTILAIAIIGAVCNAYYSIISPSRKLYKIKEKRLIALTESASRVANEYKEYMTVEFNIMKAKRSIINRLEPKNGYTEKIKISLFPKVFHFVWPTIKGKKRLKMTINQGCCGRAFRHGEGYSYNLEERKDHPDFNFNINQLILTKDLTMVASYPVYRKVEDETVLIGVANVESRTKGAGIFADDQRLKQDLYRALKTISDNYLEYSEI